MFYTSKIRSRVGDIKRFKEIITILFEEGLGFLVDKLELKYVIPLRKRWGLKIKAQLVEHAKIPLEVRFRKVFERLGGTFIKFGQYLSLRADLIGENFADEFIKLQDHVPSFPYKDVENIIKQDFGKSIRRFFKKFNEKPIAAASLAQVHRATLKSGEKVAVKVQRPNIRKIIEQDIHIIFYLAHLAEQYTREARSLKLYDLVKEFADWTMGELDFSTEGQRADRFRENLKNEPDVKIPIIYWDYTSEHVLTMEFVPGARVDDLEELGRMGIDRKKIADTGLNVLLKQMFIDGFFHGDPHPGNLFALKGNTLCFHDFGIVSYINKETRNRFLTAMISFANKNTEEYLDKILELTEDNEDADKESFKKEARAILEKIIYASFKNKSVAQGFYKILLIGAKYNVRFPTNLALLGKSFVTMEAIGLKLNPKIDLNEKISIFVNKAFLDKLKPQKFLQVSQEKTFEYLNFMDKLPKQTLKLMEKIEKGDVGVKLNLKELQGFKQELDRQNDIKIVALITAAVFLGSVIFLTLEGKSVFLGVSFGKIGLGITFLMVAWVAYLVRKKAR